MIGDYCLSLWLKKGENVPSATILYDRILSEALWPAYRKAFPAHKDTSDDYFKKNGPNWINIPISATESFAISVIPAYKKSFFFDRNSNSAINYL
jgi:hypothetical protein